MIVSKKIKSKKLSEINRDNPDWKLKNLYRREKIMTIAIYTLIIITTISIMLIAFILITNK
ncbi:MAG: hypothetical protein N3D80_13575 [Ignavibacterium album]|uniref:Uncharacterized protein n=1 Tax=Ignavibacterium album TaxID=591197 RepID=A0A7V2ZMI3_9BACT|nr:hypothetical protein [Ignavibacterium album]MCX8106892.1 hypothetical protein [Ignavibacterium album]